MSLSDDFDDLGRAVTELRRVFAAHASYWAFRFRLIRYCWQHDSIVLFIHPRHRHAYLVLEGSTAETIRALIEKEKPE